jgi:hypothetical protein
VAASFGVSVLRWAPVGVVCMGSEDRGTRFPIPGAPTETTDLTTESPPLRTGEGRSQRKRTLLNLRWLRFPRRGKTGLRRN